MHRREALGRNRHTASPIQTNLVLVGLLAAMSAGAWAVVKYIQAPPRVLGTKALKCGVFEVRYEQRGEEVQIQGCGRTVLARCDDLRCELKE